MTEVSTRPQILPYMVLAHECLDDTDLSSLRCFWYGAAPMSPARLEEALRRIGSSSTAPRTW